MPVFIGTSGFKDHYNGIDDYAQDFSTVEINATYYRWPTNAQLKTWQKGVKCLIIKVPRYLVAKSADRVKLKRFLGQMAFCEDASLAAFPRIILLFQFSNSFNNKDAMIDYAQFCAKNMAWQRGAKGYRAFFEMRHEALFDPELAKELASLGIGTVTLPKSFLSKKYNLPHVSPNQLGKTRERAYYIRFHGLKPDYKGSYKYYMLKKWLEATKRICRARPGLIVYLIFNNTEYAREDALYTQDRLLALSAAPAH